jgi:predicted small metal-binding protein
MDAPRKYIDCSKHPSANDCTLAISGSEKDVMDAAVQHAVARHGHTDTPELRSQIHSMLQDQR